MGQPAYAGVAVGMIVLAVVGSIVGWRLYKRYRWYKVRQQQERELTEQLATTEQSTGNRADSSIHFPVRAASPGPSMIGSLYGEAYPRDSMGRRSMSKASMYSMPAPGYFSGTSASEYAFPTRPRRSSSNDLLTSSASYAAAGGERSRDPSMPGSPIPGESQVGEGGVTAPSDIYDGPTHSRALSSASSTMTLKRMYAASQAAAAGGNGYRSQTPTSFRSTTPTGMGGYGQPHQRRDSYLPHLPENRHQVQIVPPQPLGFSFGMAQALDQRTLAFSKTSGIGELDDEFSRGLLWAAKEPAAAEAAVEAQLGRGANFSTEERQRYLAEGPSALGRTTNMTPAMRGAIHNLLYNGTGSQPGSSGARTPDAAHSGSHSPAMHAWDGSAASSDIGPSVSQRGQIPPSHPLEHPTASSHQPTSGLAMQMQRGLDDEPQSPLDGLMGPSRNGFPQGDGAADTSSNTISDSPILQAMQNPGQSSRQTRAAALANQQAYALERGHAPQDSMNSTHGGMTTPGLMSSTESQRSSKTGPPSLSLHHHQQQDSLSGGKGLLGDDEAQFHMGKYYADQAAPAPPTIHEPKAEKRASRGWLTGGWGQFSGDGKSNA